MGYTAPMMYNCHPRDFMGQQRAMRNITPEMQCLISQSVNLKERKDDTFNVINSEQEWLDVINRG